MTPNIEKEIKIPLTQTQFDTAEKLFDWAETIEQTNFYYIPCGDTGMTSIRVRQIGERLFLQMKVPVSEDGALHIKKEFEQELSALPDRLSAEELSKLTGMDFPAADLAGALHTQRRLCRTFAQTEICLDKSEYLGKTDFELELEYTGDYPKEALDILAKAGIEPSDKPVIGKYARFMQRTKEQNN